MTVVFSTPGLIDPRSFTTLGMNVKPNTKNPIGFFGTGLKYAIAVLVRLGAEPIVWIGKDKYIFTKKAIEFRDKEFALVHMVVTKKPSGWGQVDRLLKTRDHELPFTTEFGRTWEWWMAFRELEANTRDEGGETGTFPPPAENNKTIIIIDHPEFDKCFAQMDKIFLNKEGKVLLDSTPNVEVYEGKSDALFYRGLRVLDLKKPSQFTYNFISTMSLTEDRTMKYESNALQEVARWLSHSNDRRIISRLVHAKNDCWEHNLDFNYTYVGPSVAFREAMEKANPKKVNRSAHTYWSGYYPPAIPSIEVMKKHPIPWVVSVDGDAILDKSGVRVLTKPYDWQGFSWAALAKEVVEAVNEMNADYEVPTPQVVLVPKVKEKEDDDIPF